MLVRVHVRRWVGLIVLVVLLADMPARSVHADPLTTCTEAGFDQIIATTPAGGTIRFDCGGPATIAITHTKSITKDVRMRGDDLITISGGGRVRIFAVAPGVALGLDGMTISDGKSEGDSGGGILNRGQLDLNRVALLNNSANSGGAIYNTGLLTATASVLRDNAALATGAGIANVSGGRATLAGSTIAGGQAGVLGGGIYNSAAFTLTNSVVRDNRAILGAGIQSAGGVIVLVGSSVSGNTAAQDAGGIQNEATLRLDSSTISGNTAAGAAGGIDNSGAATLVNSTISGNRAAGQGGGIANLGALSLNNVTIANNTADSDRDSADDGGGVSNNIGGAITIKNSLLAGNLGRGGQPNDCAGTSITSQGYNLIQSIARCTLAGVATGNVTGAPALLGPLAENGGPTLTQALLVGSPAIDAGSPATPGGGSGEACAATDQRDVARPRDGNVNNTSVCDIGAYELGFVVNSSADEPDANPADNVCAANPSGKCTLRAAIQQANASIILDAISFGVTEPISLTIGGASVGAEAGDLDITDDLIIGGLGASRTIVDGGNSPAIGGVLHIGSAAHVTIAGVTIRAGNAVANNYGGAIRNEGTLQISRSIISGSTALAGGGIANWGLLTVDTSSIRDNTASINGGGIFNAFDAAINLNGGKMTLAASTISGNRATSASGSGGGIDDQGASTLTNVTISDNTAAQDGGGMRVWAGGLDRLTANNVTIVGNTADSDNNAVGRGGGLFFLSGSVSLVNTIVAGNADRSQRSPDCQTPQGASLISLGYNLIGDNSNCAINKTTGDQIGDSASPRDPRLGLLRSNGGLTATRAPLSGSPAINAGSRSRPGGLGTACVVADQRGLARPQGAACDIGASEAILADLHISQAAAPDPVLSGGRLTYRINVVNQGPSPTGGVRITDTLPLDVALVSALPSAGQCSGAAVVTCDIGTLAPGITATLTLVVEPRAARVMTNVVTIAAAEADPDLADNLARQSTRVRYPLYLPLLRQR